MTRAALTEEIKAKKSLLCVGLDSDINKIPTKFKSEKDPIFAFNKMVIAATAEYAVAYKPNIAFYECMGPAGWETLQRTMEYIPKGIFTIADAKRGDIGNTASMYAKTFFEYLNFDSVTLSPYMGKDSISPFLEYKDKWAIMLGVTSNPGALDFQFQPIAGGSERLFEKVVKHAISWENSDRIMFVAGATRGEVLASVRAAAPDHFFLVPGVGAQGGSLSEVCEHSLTDFGGLLINSSRGIIYAGDDKAVEAAAKTLQNEMKDILTQKGL